MLKFTIIWITFIVIIKEATNSSVPSFITNPDIIDSDRPTLPSGYFYRVLTDVNPSRILQVGSSSISLTTICSENGLNAYPGMDAKKYIVCVRNPWMGKWFYYVYNCPEGSFFDENIKVCNSQASGDDSEIENPCDSRKEKKEDGDYDGSVICP